MKTLVMSILLGTVMTAQAGSPDYSGHASVWDLAKDVGVSSNQISFNQGSNDVWYFMESHTIAHNPTVRRQIILDSGHEEVRCAAGPSG